MLPADFHWNENRDTLVLRGISLIRINPEHWPVQVQNIMRGGGQGMRFFSTHEFAVRYVEMWVCKWEADVRLFVANTIGAAGVERRLAEARRKDATPPTWTSSDEYGRRRGGHRNWPLRKKALPGTKQPL